MTNINTLQDDLNALIMQETTTHTEKHLVLSMLHTSYVKHLDTLGFSYDPLLGFYQQAVEVLENHFKQYNLKNLLLNDDFDGKKLFKQVKTNKNSFLLRWEYLNFDKAISQHFDETTVIAEEVVEEHPIFSRPFFIAFKGLRS